MAGRYNEFEFCATHFAFGIFLCMGIIIGKVMTIFVDNSCMVSVGNNRCGNMSKVSSTKVWVQAALLER